MSFQICKHCVMDTTAEEISFDENGICNFCHEWQETEKERKCAKSNLPWIYHQARKGCLLGLSGGVDSSLCLHYLVENDIKPYCFTIDNGWNDPKADENIMCMVEKLKVRLYRHTIDLDKFKELQSAFLKSGTKNLEIPTDHILLASSYEMARKNKLKVIIGGGNHATEGIMPKSYGYQARDLRFIKSVYKCFTGNNLKDIPTLSLAGYIYHRFIKGIKVVNLLDYYEYNREEAKKLLNEKYGWQDYGEKHCESVYTSWFQNFYLPTKFGIDKRKPHYSSLINSGQMTRKEALEKLTTPQIYPQLGLEKKVMEYPKKSYKDYPNSEKYWDLLSKVYGSLTGRR